MSYNLKSDEELEAPTIQVDENLVLTHVVAENFSSFSRQVERHT